MRPLPVPPQVAGDIEVYSSNYSSFFIKNIFPVGLKHIVSHGPGTFLTQTVRKAKYLEIYFNESHIIYIRLNSTKCE